MNHWDETEDMSKMIGYLKGLLDGSGLETDSPSGKMMKNIVSILETVVERMQSASREIDAIEQELNGVDRRVSRLSGRVERLEDADMDDFDDDSDEDDGDDTEDDIFSRLRDFTRRHRPSLFGDFDDDSDPDTSDDDDFSLEDFADEDDDEEAFLRGLDPGIIGEGSGEPDDADEDKKEDEENEKALDGLRGKGCAIMSMYRCPICDRQLYAPGEEDYPTFTCPYCDAEVSMFRIKGKSRPAILPKQGE